MKIAAKNILPGQVLANGRTVTEVVSLSSVAAVRADNWTTYFMAEQQVEMLAVSIAPDTLPAWMTS